MSHSGGCTSAAHRAIIKVVLAHHQERETRMALNPFTVPTLDELPRDRWGRPLISPPDGESDPVAYTRASTLGKVLDDTYHLNQWMKRMVALGMSKRPDLVLRAGAITDPDDRAQKKTLQDVADRAQDSAAPSAAEIGSALHQYAERVDAGEPLSIVPEEYRPDIQAYKDELAVYGLEVVSMETFVVNDTHQVGGSYDRIFKLTRDLEVTLPGRTPTIIKAGTHVIGDLKTGKSVVLGAGSFSVQLGSYANGLPYNHQSGTRGTLPTPFSTDVAVVLHMPAGKGMCTLYWLDIKAGYEVGLPLVAQVRQWRQLQRNLIAPGTGAKQALSVTAQIKQAKTVDELSKIYLRYRDQWTPGLNNLAASRKKELSA